MIINYKILEKFESQENAKNKYGYKKTLRIFESMWDEAVTLGILPNKNPLEGIKNDIELAKILNSLRPNKNV